MARVEVLTDNTVVRSSTGAGVGNTEMTLTQGSAEFNSYMRINPSLGGMALRCDGDVNVVGDLRLNNSAVGGLSIAETYLHSSSNTNGTGYWYLTTTEQQKHSSQEVTFTAPANGKIKFSATMILAGLPAAEPNGAVVYAGVYDQGASAYVVDSAGITLSSRQVWQCVPSDNATQTVEYNIDGLTPGQSYTYQLHLKSNIDDVVTVHIYAAPMIIKAVTLP